MTWNVVTTCHQMMYLKIRAFATNFALDNPSFVYVESHIPILNGTADPPVNDS